jgi:signal peptidase II
LNINSSKKQDLTETPLLPEVQASQPKASLKQYLFLFGIVALIIILDQLTKFQIRNTLRVGESWMPWAWLAPFARIVHWKNTGAAFGLFQNASTVLAILAVVVSIIVIVYYHHIPVEEKLMRTAMAMMLGGAIGNLIDRLTIGHVTDFISLGTFPVFNVADSCITIGVGILLLAMWIKEIREKRATKNLSQPEEPESGN